MKAEEILNKTIKNYNQLVNDIAKFKLNKAETEMFTRMMKEYAKQKCKEQREICKRSYEGQRNKNLVELLKENDKPDIIELYESILNAPEPKFD